MMNDEVQWRVENREHAPKDEPTDDGQSHSNFGSLLVSLSAEAGSQNQAGCRFQEKSINLSPVQTCVAINKATPQKANQQ
jgi:hypothetical protein